MPDLQRMFKQIVREAIYNDGTPAVLGRVDGSTLYFTDDSGTTHRDSVWIRYTEPNSPTLEAVVRNGGVPPQIGTPVRIILVRDVPTAVVNRYGLRAVQFSGNTGFTQTEAHAFTHKRLGSDPLYLQGLAFLPLLVRPSNPPALTVYIEPGWFRYQGQLNAWEGGDSDSLSSYIPSSSIINHFVLICLNRTNGLIDIIDGTDVNKSTLSANTTYADIKGISLADYYYPLAAIELENGQTTILVDDIIYDLRLWGGEVFGSDYPLSINIIDNIEISDAILIDALGISNQDDITVSESVTVSIV